MREQLLAAVARRTARHTDAQRLLGFLPVAEGVDAEVAGVLGSFHVRRAGRRGGDGDHVHAGVLLTPTYLTRPDALPVEARAWIEQLDPVSRLGGGSRERALALALAGMVSRLVERFLRHREPGNPEAVIGLARAAVDGLPADHPARAAVLDDLGAALLIADSRGADAELGAQAALVDESIAVLRRALGPSPHAGDPRRAAALATLVRAKGEATGQDALLFEAVRLFRAAAGIAGVGDAGEVARLAVAALASISDTPRPGMLGARLRVAEAEALRADPRLSDEQRANADRFRAGLADFLATFERIAEVGTDEFVAESLSEGAERTSAYQERTWLQLSRVYGAELEGPRRVDMGPADPVRAEDAVDLSHLTDFAFRAVREVAAAVSPGTTLSSSGVPSRPEAGDDILRRHEELLAELPADSPRHLRLLLTRAILTLDRHGAVAAPAVIEAGHRLPAILRALPGRSGARAGPPAGTDEETLARLRHELAALPDGDPARGVARLRLARALFARSLIAAGEPAYREAVTVARKALTGSSPATADLVFLWGLAAHVRAGGDDGTEDDDTPRRSAAADTDAPTAALVKIYDDDPRAALEALEAPAAKPLTVAFLTASEVDDLAATAPELTDAFLALRARDDPGRASALTRDWRVLLDRITRQPGSDGTPVLAEPRFDDLAPAATDGPVITINLHPLRCDALIARDGEAELVPLRELRTSGLIEQTEAFRAALDVLAPGAERSGPLVTGVAAAVVRDTLGWLWDVLAAPVLEALEFDATADAARPRLWWVPTGPLAFLPLHAAGRDDTAGASVLDRAVSSYTPSLRALTRSRATRALGPEQPPELVRLERPARCDPTAPWHSHVLRDDGTLTLPALTDLVPPGARLAYLSRSTTTAEGSAASETIPVAAALQLAGYAEAIAPLWEVGDDVVAWVAGRFDVERPAGPAAALHRITRELRAERGDEPWVWAAYAHAGA